MEEPHRGTGPVTSTRARIALIAGAVAGITGLALIVSALTDFDGEILAAPLFGIMSVAAIVGVIAGIAGLWAERGQRRYALAGLALTLPALVIYGFIVVLIILLVTGEIELI